MKKTVMKWALASLLTVSMAGSAVADRPTDKYCPGAAAWADWVVYFLLPQSIRPADWLDQNAC
jgi:hypothetical protein